MLPLSVVRFSVVIAQDKKDLHKLIGNQIYSRTLAYLAKTV
jgi:hypothetical protein